MSTERSPLAAVRGTMRELQVGRLADATLAGALAALLLAFLLAGLKLDVVGALGTLCVLLVLLLLASYDLVVRWTSLDLTSPDRDGPGRQEGWLRLLRRVWPEVVLVAGMLTGHFLWRG